MPTASLVVLLVPFALLWPAAQGHATPQTEGQQACIAGLNRAGVGVARAQAALTATCLAPGTPTVAACVTNDADPGLAAALRATFEAAVAGYMGAPERDVGLGKGRCGVAGNVRDRAF